VKKNNVDQIEGLFLIIDHGNVKGLQHWADEFERRGMPAVIQTNEYMVTEQSRMIKDLCMKGFEICGSFNEQPFWDKPYSFQHEVMSRLKDEVEACTGKPMRIFGSKYSAYDEVTLRVADELGVQYVFARGAAGARAVVYKPKEYTVTIVSVSNVPSKQLGTGSLCDQSLWSRGAAPDDFKEILFNLKEDRIILVAQTHLSGVKLHWWNVYQDFLDADIVAWKSLDEFVINPTVLSNEQIPVNNDVQYITPQPRIPLEHEIDYPFEEQKKIS
jgi:peptidoglycan/xylan/chitin deacetylase (PgdA/CDA1 family)